MIATMLGAERNDLAFIVLLASPGVNGIESLDAQNRALYEESGGLSDDLLEARLEILRSSNSLVAGEGDLDTVLQQAREYLAEALEPYTARQRARMGFPSDNEMLLQAMASPWLRYLLAYEPARDLRRISIPVLALYGTRDLQVLAEQNAPAVRAALEAARNTRFEVLVLENLNHLFQTAETGLPSEYGRIDETMSPLVLEKIENWILGLSTID